MLKSSSSVSTEISASASHRRGAQRVDLRQDAKPKARVGGQIVVMEGSQNEVVKLCHIRRF